MAITKSAKKALRGSKRKRVFNEARRASLRSTAKVLKKAVGTAETASALAAAYKAVDKAAKKGLLKKNTANRRKSQLSKLLKVK